MNTPMIKPSHRGLLHKSLGVPQDDKISVAALQRAKNSDNPVTRKRANFAINARKWGRKDGGQVKNW